MVTYKFEVEKAADKLRVLLIERNKMKEDLHNAELNQAIVDTFLVDLGKARIVVQNVANKVQQDLEYRISGIVTMALAAVFSDPYEFKVRFVQRRNQTECDMFFVKDGNECDPIDSSGGGAIDIASLALRMAIWSIKKTRAIQILDEPMRFLSRDMQSKGSEMIKILSDRLGIQIIMVSHIPEAIDFADRVFTVDNDAGISNVTYTTKEAV